MAMLREVLRGDPNLGATNRYGGVALIPASDRGHVDTCGRSWLETEIDVDHVNRLGWTALLEAVILGDGGPGHVEIVQLLLDAGADRSITDRDGVTALEHARERGYDEMVALLEARGAPRRAASSRTRRSGRSARAGRARRRSGARRRRARGRSRRRPAAARTCRRRRASGPPATMREVEWIGNALRARRRAARRSRMPAHTSGPAAIVARRAGRSTRRRRRPAGCRRRRATGARGCWPATRRSPRRRVGSISACRPPGPRTRSTWLEASPSRSSMRCREAKDWCELCMSSAPRGRGARR